MQPTALNTDLAYSVLEGPFFPNNTYLKHNAMKNVKVCS